MSKKMYPYYFTFGALILYTLLIVVPGVMGIFYSFTDWNVYSTNIHFIGLENFRKIFSPKQHYISYIYNTLEFTLLTIILKTVLGLFYAILLSEGIKLINLHRTLLYVPAILSTLTIGIVFKSILNPETGILNEFLRLIGLDFLAQQWLTNVKIAFLSVIGVDTWKGIGYIMTLFLAGIKSIPSSYYEACEIDGATFWSKLWYITLPLLRPTLMVTLVLNMFYGLKVFDIVYVLTNGGPGHTTDVLYTDIFSEFGLGKYGLATAMTSMLFIFLVAVGFFVVHLMTRKEVEM
jgi:raffinose/stachyose/melibiose transport system permease protein